MRSGEKTLGQQDEEQSLPVTTRLAKVVANARYIPWFSPLENSLESAASNRDPTFTGLPLKIMSTLFLRHERIHMLSLAHLHHSSH